MPKAMVFDGSGPRLALYSSLILSPTGVRARTRLFSAFHLIASVGSIVGPVVGPAVRPVAGPVVVTLVVASGGTSGWTSGGSQWWKPVVVASRGSQWWNQWLDQWR